MYDKPIRIGTRNSKLALWQAQWVGRLLEAAGMRFELCPMVSKGDQILDRSLAKIGSKGLFTEELEQALRHGEIDIAQHSAKDLQAQLPADLELIAFTQREHAHDVVLSLNPDLRLEDAQSWVIGSSSTRRRAMMQKYYPQHRLVDLRGNLQTRLEKLKQGACDAMLLAYAGVHRMEFDAYVVQELDLKQFIPAVGQGSVAIQCATALDPKLKALIRSALNHEASEQCLLAERQVLAQLDGGCSVPVFGHAHWKDEQMQLEAGVMDLNGQTFLYAQGRGNEPIALGNHIAQELLNQGAKALLRQIRSQG